MCMYQKLNEPVDTLVYFEGAKIKPLRFRWNGHVYRIKEITAHWQTRRGIYVQKRFTAVDFSENYFQLCYDLSKNGWQITRMLRESGQ